MVMYTGRMFDLGDNDPCYVVALGEPLGVGRRDDPEIIVAPIATDVPRENATSADVFFRPIEDQSPEWVIAAWAATAVPLQVLVADRGRVGEAALDAVRDVRLSLVDSSIKAQASLVGRLSESLVGQLDWHVALTSKLEASSRELADSDSAVTSVRNVAVVVTFDGEFPEQRTWRSLLPTIRGFFAPVRHLDWAEHVFYYTEVDVLESERSLAPLFYEDLYFRHNGGGYRVNAPISVPGFRRFASAYYDFSPDAMELVLHYSPSQQANTMLPNPIVSPEVGVTGKERCRFVREGLMTDLADAGQYTNYVRDKRSGEMPT